MHALYTVCCPHFWPFNRIRENSIVIQLHVYKQARHVYIDTNMDDVPTKGTIHISQILNQNYRH